MTSAPYLAQPGNWRVFTELLNAGDRAVDALGNRHDCALMCRLVGEAGPCGRHDVQGEGAVKHPRAA